MAHAREVRGPRFRKISRYGSRPQVNCFLLPAIRGSLSGSAQQLSGDLEQWPYFKLLLHSYNADRYRDEAKYDHYKRSTNAEIELHSGASDGASDEPPTSERRSKLGPSPLHAYEQAFNWQADRASSYGSRPSMFPTFEGTGMTIGIKASSFELHAGLVEPIYGTLSLFDRERSEKLSEDMHFQFVPAGFSNSLVTSNKRCIFSLEAPSTSICIVIQLEKHATEENGIKPSVYSRKEPAYLTETEKERLQARARRTPLREPFAWAVLPLLDKTNRIAPGVTRISTLNRVEESYSEEWLQETKRKPQKHVRATMDIEIEPLTAEQMSRSPARKTSIASSEDELEDAIRSEISSEREPELQAMEFRQFTRREPFTELVHTAFIYPMSLHVGKNRNVSVRVELRVGDSDPLQPGCEAIYPRETGYPMQSWADTQVAANTKTAHFHEEIKVRLPAVLKPDHHLVFTFFQFDLGLNAEPTIIGYAVQPLFTISSSTLVFSLPVVKKLVPNYLQDATQNELVFVEGSLFRLRLRFCSSLFPLNEPIRDFFIEFDEHYATETSSTWSSELIESINNITNADSTSMVQFLHPILNLLLYVISDSDGSQIHQVAAFRAMINLLKRLHQTDTERSRHVVQYIDIYFDDFGGHRSEVHRKLCNVWRSLVSSKKEKGYRVGQVYEDSLSMAWVSFELIVRSMALQQAREFPESFPADEPAPPLQLSEEVLRCLSSLYNILLSEVHECCQQDRSLAKQLNSSLAFFCFDMLSFVEPRQVLELVALYLDKFNGECSSAQHECKLTFLQIVCDHDLFVELPGKDPAQRYYIATMFMREMFLTLDHTDLSKRTKAARILVVSLCKHEFDSRYQSAEDKLYIAQLYFQLVDAILDEVTVFYNLNKPEKRDILICVLQTIRHLDDASLIKAWSMSVSRTKLFFILMEECLAVFEKTSDDLSASVSLQVLEVTEKFIVAASVRSIETDYVKLDCITKIITEFLSRKQPFVFWKAFFRVFSNLFRHHGATLLERQNDRFLKKITFELLQLALLKDDAVRRMAVVGLQILLRSFFCYFESTTRLRVILTITVSELITQIDGENADHLKRSLQEMSSEELSPELLRHCDLPDNCLNASMDGCQEDRWRWWEAQEISASLLQALDASIELSPVGSVTGDKYAAAESVCSLALAYSQVPDLQIMWLLQLCDIHREVRLPAEAAQCATAVAGIIIQSLASDEDDAVWTRANVEGIRKICPVLSKGVVVKASAAEVEGYGASKLTLDSAIKHLELANTLFSEAGLFHFCAVVIEQTIPVYRHRKAHRQLDESYTSLASIHKSISEQESSPIPAVGATYYRIGFYGQHFGKLNRKEYVYREADGSRLGDMITKLRAAYESRIGTVQIIHDSDQVKPDDLQAGACYFQITAVDPIAKDQDNSNPSTKRPVAGSSVFDHFSFDTLFTKSQKTQGLQDQWKRRTVLQTEASFPGLLSRLPVIKSESREFSPVENATEMVKTRTLALQRELEQQTLGNGLRRSQNSQGRSPESEVLQARRLESLKGVLQGSVAVQVNTGIMGVCTAFLSRELAITLDSEELQLLISTLREFMRVCKVAMQAHAMLIGDEDDEFHLELVNGFQSLAAELSHYIPAILSDL